MSLPIDYIFMNSRDKRCRDHQHSELIQDINWIHNKKYHPCLDELYYHRPLYCLPTNTSLFMFCVIPWDPRYLAHVLFYLGVLPSLFVKNVVRISPPLKKSWYNNTSCHLRSFLGPRVVFNRNTDNWAMTCEFKTSSNPIALRWMGDSSF